MIRLLTRGRPARPFWQTMLGAMAKSTGATGSEGASMSSFGQSKSGKPLRTGDRVTHDDGWTGTVRGRGTKLAQPEAGGGMMRWVDDHEHVSVEHGQTGQRHNCPPGRLTHA